ncbi:hypothetical protein KXR87_18720 [Yokenella regensburgei]|uniref:hypothetical protein n=1 Tax=Yokenella regensburgei TaxID=158877 RepID=UPI003F143AE9
MKTKTFTTVSLLTAALFLAGCDNKEEVKNTPPADQHKQQAQAVNKTPDIPADAAFTAINTNLQCLGLYKKVSGTSPDENYAFLIAPQELMKKEEHFERTDFINSMRAKIDAMTDTKVSDYFTLTLIHNDRKPNNVFITRYIEANDQSSAHPKGVAGFQVWVNSDSKQFLFNEQTGYEKHTNCAIDLSKTERISFIPATDETLARTISKSLESGKMSVRYFLKATGTDYVGNSGQPNMVPLPLIKSEVLKLQLLGEDGAVLTQVNAPE